MEKETAVITQLQLDEIVSIAEQEPLNDALLVRLRAAYPDAHFTRCLDDEVSVNAQPTVERPSFNLYLVNSSSHCSVLTNDLASASGIVLAEIIEAGGYLCCCRQWSAD